MVDFNPKLPEPEDSNIIESGENNESIVLEDDKSLSVLNLVKLASAHAKDYVENRKITKDISKELKEDMYAMSIKEKIEYLKVTTRLLEINAKALRELYTIGMRTELAKQFLLEGIKNEKSVRNITPRINKVLGLLQKTDKPSDAF